MSGTQRQSLISYFRGILYGTLIIIAAIMLHYLGYLIEPKMRELRYSVNLAYDVSNAVPKTLVPIGSAANRDGEAHFINMVVHSDNYPFPITFYKKKDLYYLAENILAENGYPNDKSFLNTLEDQLRARLSSYREGDIAIDAIGTDEWNDEELSLLWVNLTANLLVLIGSVRVAWSLLLILMFPILLKIASNKMPNRCLFCGYDLRAHEKGDRCPECGAVIKGDPQEPNRS